MPIPSLVPLWASYYTCNIIRVENLWFSKCVRKVNLFCDSHIVITYWLKKIKKTAFLKYLFLWERTVTVSGKKLSSNIVFRRNSFGKFYIVKLNCFSGRPKIRWKRCFEIFLIDHCIDDIRIKILLVIIKKLLYQCHPLYTRRLHL